jgi:hypothetical protein
MKTISFFLIFVVVTLGQANQKIKVRRVFSTQKVFIWAQLAAS